MVLNGSAASMALTMSRRQFCGFQAASFQRAAPIKPTAALGIVLVAQSADTRGEVTNDLSQHRPRLSHLFHMTGGCGDRPLRHLWRWRRGFPAEP